MWNLKLSQSSRPDPFFLADDRALDFLNSVSAPWGSEIEWLGDGRELIDWLEKAGMVPVQVAYRFRNEISAGALDEVAGRARDLRQWFREFVVAHAGRPLDGSAFSELGRINNILARDEVYRQIELQEVAGQDLNGVNFSLRWRYERRWEAAEDLLLPLAVAMGDLLCDADFTRVKNCQGHNCTLWFHDISKNHTRRWCSMSICGNRAKAATHRAKKRKGPL